MSKNADTPPEPSSSTDGLRPQGEALEALTPQEALQAMRADGLAPPAVQTERLIGRELGQYRLTARLGQGGMGAVYKADDKALHRTCAVKVLYCGPLEDQRTAERFQREAQSLARLSHPNLLHVYNVGNVDDLHYFAMELLEGSTLSQLLRARSRLPMEEFLPMAGQLLSALDYVHKQGITHRDIKSGNIMICGSRAVLMDFGLAKDEQHTGLTSVGMVLGTPEYMSPEQAEGLTCGPPADIYSFGVVLYEALSGDVPFRGRSALAIIRQHLDEPAPLLEARLPGIHPRLSRIVQKCLAKAPEDRYPNCAALAADLVKVCVTQELLHLSGGHDERATVAKAGLPARLEIPGSQGQAGTEATVLGTAPRLAPRPDPRAAEGDLKPTVLAPLTQRAPAAAKPAPPVSGAPFGLWTKVALGIGGLILLVLLGLALRGPRRNSERKAQGETPPVQPETPEPSKPPAPPAYRTVRVPAADGRPEEEMRFKSFRQDPAQPKDPAGWRYVVERKGADGTWREAELSQAEFQRLMGERALEFLTPEGRAAEGGP